MDFDLRPATPADRAFIWALRQATMRPLIEPLEGWHEPTQRGYADESLAGRIVVVGGEPAGVLTVRNRGSELHLTWVAVLPQLQGFGLGTALLRRAQQEAAAARLPLTLRVMRANPAVRLYERMGFSADGPVVAGLPTDRLTMRWLSQP
jgi:GNAT superfamily N-acetyltransferase